ncbi:MAG: DUF2709 domain-containing protein [Chlamydiia bacterium]
MAAIILSDEIKAELDRFFAKNRKVDLVTAYLFYVEKKFNLSPVLFLRDKIIYQSKEDAIRILEREGRLWKETEIKIQLGTPAVTEETRKIYICPWTGKVFGNNTHPNPQDAIYDWVGKCPENTERVGGLKAKRFWVSEDPEVIKQYISKRREPITKIVFSSMVTGKLFNSKASVIRDFEENYVKPLTLVEVQNQNRYTIEEHFLHFIQSQLTQERLAEFVEALSEDDLFQTMVERWTEEEETAEA